MSGMGVFCLGKLFKSIQAKEGELFKRIQADGETGGSWVVQNDPSQGGRSVEKDPS